MFKNIGSSKVNDFASTYASMEPAILADIEALLDDIHAMD